MAERNTVVNVQWLAIGILFLLQLTSLYNNGRTTEPVAHTMPSTGASITRAMRRSLQQATETEAPSAEVVEDVADAAIIEPASLPPAPEQHAAPAPDPDVSTQPAPSCDCLPPTLPPEMAFLKDAFEWDADRQALIINAKTIDASGHLIVNGFSGVRQSLFIGGDPNNGESATEISPGSILLYKAGEDAYPTLAGFQTQEDGYDISRIEVMGGLQILNADSGDVTVVGA